jgi:hypothetical protein
VSITPTEAAFLAPAIGAGGALLGVWLTGRRDDKRTRDERASEQARWSREDRLRLDSRWLDMRRATYVQMLRASQAWLLHLGQVFSDVTQNTEESAMSPSDEFRTSVSSAMAEIELFQSEAIENAARDLVGALFRAHTMVNNYHAWSTYDRGQMDSDGTRLILSLVQPARERFLHIAQKDLGRNPAPAQDESYAG